jgi:dienelactone hydrolase
MERRLSRRQQLATMLAAGAGAAASATTAAAAAGPPPQQQETSYTGALDGFEAKVDPRAFDPVLWTRTRWESAPLRLTYPATAAQGGALDRKQTRKWQARLRRKVRELVGGFPATRIDLSPVTLEKRDFPGYTREKLVFTSNAGVQVLGYLLTPAAAAAGPLPVVICVPGHGRGVDDIVGIDAQGRERTNKAGYQHDFAIQVAEAGMAALAIEPMAFGCRRDPLTKKRGLGTAACQPAAGAALLFGETMIAWRVWDVMRAIDWIETRPQQLDASRIGCMGISGGGTCTVFAAALEPRIKAAMVSGYLNTFRDSILSLSHCMDNYVPGILNWCEMYDVAGLIAPRPLFIESGDKDNIFPIEASRESYKRVKRVYESMNAGEAVAQEVFEGEHSFHGKLGIPFLKKALT